MDAPEKESVHASCCIRMEEIAKSVIVRADDFQQMCIRDRIKADDILMALDITMLGVLTILAVCQQTGRCEREIAALKCIEDVRFSQLRSALFIQKLLSGERVVLVNEVRFDGSVVRILRGDMLERCHTVHPELSRRSAEMRSGLQVRQEFSLVSARCLHRQN